MSPLYVKVLSKPEDDPSEEHKGKISNKSCLSFLISSALVKMTWGKTSNPDICHKVHLLPESVPPSRLHSMSSYSEHEREFMLKEIKMLLQLGIIQKSQSSWTFAPAIVRKQAKL
jgi:hypothetical protein